MQRNLIFFLIVLYSSSCNNWSETDMSDISQQFLEVPYASLSAAQKLDVFIPEGEGPFPAVMLIHGGGFKWGDKSSEYLYARKLVANGYIAVPINYRLVGEATFPAAVHDCKAAIRFLRSNATTYKIQPDKIGTWGASAGGNLSAMMGTSAGDTFADGSVGDHLTQSTKIQAAVDWFGPINFATMIPEARELGLKKNFNVKIESEYLGADASDPANAGLVAQASPTTYLDAEDPPFWVAVGDKDPLIPYLQSVNFARALETVLGKEKVYFNLLEGAGHGGASFETEENLNRAIAFFDKYLK